MVETERAVFLRYQRDGSPRRASGLRVAGRYVLTADHCARGSDHMVVVAGTSYQATVHARTDSDEVDLAVLHVPGLPEVAAAPCARIDRGSYGTLRGCVAVGFPRWKGSDVRPVSAQLDGDVPLAEGVDPRAKPGAARPFSLKISNQDVVQQHPLPDGSWEGTPWAGMSGAVVVSSKTRCWEWCVATLPRRAHRR